MWYNYLQLAVKDRYLGKKSLLSDLEQLVNTYCLWYNILSDYEEVYQDFLQKLF